MALLFGGCRMHHNSFFHSSPEEKAEKIINYISDELDMNEAQRIVMNKIKEDIIEKHKELHADKGDMHNKAFELATKETLTKADLEAAFGDKADKIMEMKDFMMEKIVEFHAILTPEQKKTVAEKMEKFHDKCGR